MKAVSLIINVQDKFIQAYRMAYSFRFVRENEI